MTAMPQLMRRLAIGCSAVVCAGLIGTAVTPAVADVSDPRSTLVGGFGVGDGLEATIDPRDGAGTFSVAAAGLALAWDSRLIAAGDRTGFGPGWSLGVSSIGVGGGVRVMLPSGRVLDADASRPTGLAGYPTRDLRFEQLPAGVLPARPDGAVGERPTRFALHELGGTTTHYDAEGRAVARVGPDGARVDWIWPAAGPSRLERVVDVNGVETDLDWAGAAGEVRVRGGANLSAEPAGTMPGAHRDWRVRFDDDGIREVTDPLDGRTELDYDGGLLVRLATDSGAQTDVDWQVFDDAVPRVERVRTTDATGRELSARRWTGVDGLAATGWPLAGSPGSPTSPVDYVTELDDGVTTVRSTYSGAHALERRDVHVRTATGAQVAQSQMFEYDAAVAAAGRPTSSSLVVADGRGGSRTTTVHLAFDEFGRVIRETAADGTVTATEYDSTPRSTGALPDAPPVGLPTVSTVTAPDGLVAKTVSTLNDTRTAVVATEQQQGRVGAALTVGERTEYTVEADGFVSDERRLAGGASTASVTTRRHRATDLESGTRTITTTSDIGSAAESTTTETVSLLHGAVIASTGPTGATTSARYDALGRVAATTDASGNETRTEYATWRAHGRNATTTTTADGVAQTEEFDELGRLVRRTDNLLDGAPEAGHVRVAEVRAYPDAATVRITDAWGATTEAVQDAFGREVRSAAANGLVRVTAYDDAAGTVTTGFTPTGELADAEAVTTEHRDLNGRTTETGGERADGRPVAGATASYDGLGRMIGRSDGRVDESVRLDEQGRALTTTVAPAAVVAPGADTAPGAGVQGARPGTTGRIDPDGSVTADRRYDGFGNPVQKTLSDGVERVEGGTRVLDPLGRVLRQTDRAGRTTDYRYTADELVARVETSTGEVTETEYDALTRRVARVTRSAPGRADVTTVTEYDSVTGLPIAVFDPADRAGSEITYRHDAFGNVTRVTYPDGAVIEHGYDEHGRRETTTDPAGNVTRFAYDAAGLLTAAVQRAGAGTPRAHEVLAEVGYRYDDYGRVSGLDRGNGVSTAFTFTSAGEIASETTKHGDETRSARAYEYDAHGNLTTRVDRVVDDRIETVRTTTYTYDPLNRLRASRIHAGATADAPITREREYEVSVAGAITFERTVDAPGTPDAASSERRFEYSPAGELLAIVTDGVRATQTYDESGQLTNGNDGHAVSYDAAGRPVSRRSGDVTTEYGYWADGSRRGMTTTDHGSGSSTSTSFYWDGNTLLSEHHHAADRDGTASYLNAATRHSRTTVSDDGVDTSYYGADRHGDVTDLTDSNGETVERYAYDDYGVTSAVGADAASARPSASASESAHRLDRNPFRYAGEYQDPDGTYRLGGVRSYDPAVRSFTTPDPADLFTDYAYADLNPIAKVDPTGRNAETFQSDGIWGVFGWIAFGFSVLASAVILAGAVFTAGWSLSGLGVLNIAVQATTTALAAVQVADLVAPETLTDEQGFGVSVSEIGIGLTGAFFGIMYGVVAWAEGANVRRAFRQVGRAVERATDARDFSRAFKSRWKELVTARGQTIVSAMKGGNGLPAMPREVAVKIADENFIPGARELLRAIAAWKQPNRPESFWEQSIQWAADDYQRLLRNQFSMTRSFRARAAAPWVEHAHEGLRGTKDEVTELSALAQTITRAVPPEPIDAVLTLPT